MIIQARYFFLLFAFYFFSGCATYFEKSADFQRNFVRGDFDAANEVLDRNKGGSKGKDRLLYYLQKGVVLQMMGQYDESNKFLEEAYIFVEDFRKNYGQMAAGILINPEVEPYIGEDFEIVLIHYYKALNYLFKKEYDPALVECRRMNIKLNLLNDKYDNRKNRYKRDAFIHNLMGIIYEASGDVNNAFIAYRNAFEVYKEDYQSFFGAAIPEQLKKDLLRTAYLNGFSEELERYESQFGTKYRHLANEGGELVFFWHNGLGPVKGEWSINFFILKGTGGIVTFANEEYNLSFPFPVSSTEENEGIGDLKIVRAAFPKYLERKPYYRSAGLSVNGQFIPLELAENINDIAFKTLEDRMLREFSKSLLRLAIKQAAEERLRKENENLGALLSVVSAIAERADTRNWQSLPYSISYARVPLKEGGNNLKLSVSSPKVGQKLENEFYFHSKKGETQFYLHHTLESIGLHL